jgi:GxxExxY protein
MGRIEVKNSEILFPELSYDIVGACFDAFNGVGPEKSERIYQKAVEIGLEKRKRKFQRQVHCPVIFESKTIGYFFLDLLVDDSVVVELKVGERFRRKDYDQVKTYLKLTGKDLGILVRFSDDGVTYSRILKSNQTNPNS